MRQRDWRHAHHGLWHHHRPKHFSLLRVAHQRVAEDDDGLIDLQQAHRGCRHCQLHNLASFEPILAEDANRAFSGRDHNFEVALVRAAGRDEVGRRFEVAHSGLMENVKRLRVHDENVARLRRDDQAVREFLFFDAFVNRCHGDDGRQSFQLRLHVLLNEAFDFILRNRQQPLRQRR